MNKLFERIYFHNGSVPALNETNLNAISKAIDDIDNRVVEIGITEENIAHVDDVKKAVDSVGEEVKNDKATIESDIVQAKADMEAEVSKAKEYRDEAFHTTPAGYEQVVSDVETNKTNIAENTTDITSLKNAFTNKNLLDNSWFQVNQRNVSTYTDGGYFVDRWTSLNNMAKLVVSSEGIKFTGTGYYRQYIDADTVAMLQNEVFTLSILLEDGTIASDSGRFDGSIQVAPIEGDNLLLYHSANQPFFAIRGGSGEETTKTVRAVKLELGDKSTLANDTMPIYAEELLRCQMSRADSTDAYANGNSNWVDITSECAFNTNYIYTTVQYFVKINPILRLMHIAFSGKPIGNQGVFATIPSKYLPSYLPATDTNGLVFLEEWDTRASMSTTLLLNGYGQIRSSHTKNIPNTDDRCVNAIIPY